MAASFEVGTFTADTGSSSTTVSTSFQGKAVIFFNHGKTTLSETAGASWDIAFYGSGNGDLGWTGNNGVTTTAVWRRYNDTSYTPEKAAILSAGSASNYITGVAFNATPNMVVTFNATPGSAWKINYILLGGDDITATYVGSDTMPTSPGIKTISDVGFQGDIALFFTDRRADVGIITPSTVALGIAISKTKRWVCLGHTENGQTSDASVHAISKVRANACLQVGFYDNDDLIADFNDGAGGDGWTADGFKLNFTDAPEAAYRFGYMVIKGGQWDGGVQVKPSTATAETFSGMAFTPKLLAMLMSSATDTSTYSANQISTFGATDGTNQAYAGSYHGTVVESGTVAYSAASSSALSHEMQATADATFNSFSSGQAVIDWSAAGTAYETAWFAGGDTTTPSYEGTVSGEYLVS